MGCEKRFTKDFSFTFLVLGFCVSSSTIFVKADVFSSLPEVANAASTNSITMKGSILKQSFKECPDGRASDKYRTADGTCNNVLNLGSANRPVRRLVPSAYDDGLNTPRSLDSRGLPLPTPTDISRVIHPAKDVSQRFTVMLMQWGQFIDHDMAGFPISSEVDRSIQCCDANKERLVNNTHKDCFAIILSHGDKRFVGQCMEFARSVAARNKDGNQIVPREQINSVTSFMDGSVVYGNSRKLQEELREPGPNGTLGFLLRTSTGDLLPRSDEEGNCIHQGGHYCFLTGDTRVNEQPGLIAMHTVFVRLHNKIARELAALRPGDTNEELFQQTRKIVAAVIQNIHYSEWLPLILGRKKVRQYGLQTGSRSHFVPSVDPRISNSFSTATFRFGHSLIPSGLNISGRYLPLHLLFNRPDEIFRNFSAVFMCLISPLKTSGAHSMDRFFSDEITGHLFEKEDHQDGQPSRGLDLIALNIQRGRDHGLAPYNKYRQFCGLPALESFQDLPAKVVEDMTKVYNSVEDIDLFSGLMTEDAAKGQMVGPTLSCLLANQFHALKHGDRFYFENDHMPEGFTDDQLKAIRNVHLADLCCQVEGVTTVPKRAFEILSKRNPLVDCSELRRDFLNLAPWQTF